MVAVVPTRRRGQLRQHPEIDQSVACGTRGGKRQRRQASWFQLLDSTNLIKNALAQFQCRQSGDCEK